MASYARQAAASPSQVRHCPHPPNKNHNVLRRVFDKALGILHKCPFLDGLHGRRCLEIQVISIDECLRMEIKEKSGRK